MNFWVSQMPGDAIAVSLKVIQPLLGVDLSNPLEQSANLLRRAASLRPNHYWTYFWLGWNRLAGKHFASAELSFDTCIALKPNYALAYAYRGWSLLLESRTAVDAPMRDNLVERGFADLTQARSLEPTNPEFLWLSGQALEASGRLLEALESYQRAAELEPPLETWEGRHLFTEKQRLFQQMFDVATKFSADEPKQAEGWTALAVAAWTLGKADDAKAAAEKALAVRPSEAKALEVRGAAALLRGNSTRPSPILKPRLPSVRNSGVLQWAKPRSSNNKRRSTKHLPNSIRRWAWRKSIGKSPRSSVAGPGSSTGSIDRPKPKRPGRRPTPR